MTEANHGSFCSHLHECFLSSNVTFTEDRTISEMQHFMEFKVTSVKVMDSKMTHVP